MSGYEWTPGTWTSRTIWATIQPLDPRELQDLPEGLRSTARYACFTYESLGVPGTELPDQVQVGGEWYEVHGGHEDARFGGAPIPGNEYILVEPSP